jgi:sugar lactone lactonase YvrE
MTITIERIGSESYALGEGPLWDPVDAVLYFVDIDAPAIHRYDPSGGAFQHWDLPTKVGSMALRERGGAVLACADGFHLFDFAAGARTLIGDPETHKPHTIFNDGRVDRRGRFIAGTLANHSLSGVQGAVYRLDPDLTWQLLADGFSVTNGPCWSPDGECFYVSDSMTHTIFVYDYDLETGAASGKRIFATTEELGGVPDGTTVDADGCLWCAICMGGRIARFTPDGRVDRTFDVPMRWVTSVMFGGPHLDTLYLTGLDPLPRGETGNGPAEGGLYAVSGLGATGLPEPRFAG